VVSVMRRKGLSPREINRVGVTERRGRITDLR
jgi:hypothetical protein